MNFKAALIGLPNVGKSLLFNILINAFKAESQNYPFCTIKPNEAIISFNDERLSKYQIEYKSNKLVPTTVKFFDIAGIISGAAEGVGLGNEFLSHIYTTDCIIHVIRCFDSEEVLHVCDTVDPIRDFNIIRDELIKKDLQVIESYIKAKNYKDKVELLKKVQAELQKTLETKENHMHPLNDPSIHLLSYKPFIILCNGDASVDKSLQTMIDYCVKNNYIYEIVNAAELELNITTPDNDAFIQNTIKKCREVLNIISFFTCGPEEIHAWNTQKGTNIRIAAGEIHSDFTTKFIKAKVTAENSNIEKVVDASYIVVDGDVVTIMHSR